MIRSFNNSHGVAGSAKPILLIQRAARCSSNLRPDGLNVIQVLSFFHSEAVFPQLQAELFPKCRLARSAFEVGAASVGNLFT